MRYLQVRVTQRLEPYENRVEVVDREGRVLGELPATRVVWELDNGSATACVHLITERVALETLSI